jgi:flagellar FliJ protein
MSKDRFSFRMQRLLTLREKAERQAAIDLATAQAAHASARTAADVIDAQRAAAREAARTPLGEARTVSAIRQAAILLEQLDGRQMQADALVRSADEQVHARVGVLGERVRERRVLDRLRDRQHDEWRTDADRRERELMDGLARSRGADATLSSSPDR